MSDYYNVTTNNGDAAIATAIANNTKLNITHIAFGDGNGAVPTPNKARTTLVKEVYRQAVAKYERHPTIANYLIVEVVIPSDIGGFYIREIGLIADGILISHGSHAPFYKVAEPNGVSEFHLKYTINIQDGGVVDLILDESLIYATEGWVDENYVPRDEIIDNLTTDDSLKPVSAKQAKVLQDNKLGKTENAASATKLKNARKINNVDFDGTSNIEITANVPFITYLNSKLAVDGAISPGMYTIGDYSIAGLYNYGMLFVHKEANVINQIFYADSKNSVGSIAMRQTWSGDITSEEWIVVDKGLDFSATLNAVQGTQKLPSGMILQWGNGVAADLGQVTFPITFPNSCFGITISDRNGDVQHGYIDLQNSGFKVKTSVPSLTFFYMAIGY